MKALVMLIKKEVLLNKHWFVYYLFLPSVFLSTGLTRVSTAHIYVAVLTLFFNPTILIAREEHFTRYRLSGSLPLKRKLIPFAKIITGWLYILLLTLLFILLLYYSSFNAYNSSFYISAADVLGVFSIGALLTLIYIPLTLRYDFVKGGFISFIIIQMLFLVYTLISGGGEFNPAEAVSIFFNDPALIYKSITGMPEDSIALILTGVIVLATLIITTLVSSAFAFKRRTNYT